jgi:EAL domain-containing protein (putative c-di-GMP-specific phosphodiesterase class I)
VLSPLEFIPLAEETGQITELGRWTVEESCAQVSRWQRLEPDLATLSVSVNLSPRQLHDSRIVGEVARSLAATGLDPASLVLEITEGAVMADVETAIQHLRALQGLGVSLAIDDFGTGHSSLALLRRLPVDTLKVDKMFVDSIASDPTALSFLETIVRLADILEMQVVVEGIETPEQAALVAGLGVFGQGYHFCRPTAVGAMDAVLTAACAEQRLRKVADLIPRLAG